MSETDHESKAEDHAERAGGYLQAAERFVEGATPGDVAKAQAFAAMAQVSATLSLAQRIAAQDDPR